MSLDISIFNNNFEKIEIIDQYQSLIWTDKYCGPGDFELYMFYFEGWDKIFVPGYYLKIEKTGNRYMIIEDTKVEWDYTGRNTILITGRSLESILDRRIVLVPLYYNLVESTVTDDNDYINIIKYSPLGAASISTIINDVITKNCIRSSDEDLFNNIESTPQRDITTKPPYYDYIKNMSYGSSSTRKSRRNIDNLIFYNDSAEASNAIYHTTKPYNIHFENISVLEAVKSICNRYQIGFKIEYKKDDRPQVGSGQMVFFTSLYVGENLYNVHDLSKQVIFSPILDNVLSASIANYNSKYKNMFIFKTQNAEELPMGDYEDYRILTGLGNGMLDINFRNLSEDSHATYTKYQYFCKWWNVSNLVLPSGLNLKECFTERYIKDTFIGYKNAGANAEYTFSKFDLTAPQIKANTRQDDVKFIIDQTKATKDIDIKIDPNNTMYKLGEDYNLGDVVGVWMGGETVEKMRITAITHVKDGEGYRIYPTFEKYIDLIIDSDDAYRVSSN